MLSFEFVTCPTSSLQAHLPAAAVVVIYLDRRTWRRRGEPRTTQSVAGTQGQLGLGSRGAALGRVHNLAQEKAAPREVVEDHEKEGPVEAEGERLRRPLQHDPGAGGCFQALLIQLQHSLMDHLWGTGPKKVEVERPGHVGSLPPLTASIPPSLGFTGGKAEAQRGSLAGSSSKRQPQDKGQGLSPSRTQLTPRLLP